MTSRRGNTILFRSSQRLPRLRLGPLTHPPALLPELQRNKDTFGCAALGADVPGQRQLQLTQTLIVHLLDSQFFLLYQKLDPCPPCLYVHYSLASADEGEKGFPPGLAVCGLVEEEVEGMM